MEHIDTDNLSQRVDLLRQEAGISVLQLANLTRIPLTTLQRRLAGDGQMTVTELSHISKVLNVTAASWFGAKA